MGLSPLADIPGNFFVARLGSHASVASNGANALLADAFWVAPANVAILSVWRQVATDEATHGTASTSASYRRVTILNQGTAGTGTTILASHNGTASLAASGVRAFTTTANSTVTAGGVVGASQLTVGGTDNDGTVLQAGILQIAYQLL